MVAFNNDSPDVEEANALDAAQSQITQLEMMLRTLARIIIAVDKQRESGILIPMESLDPNIIPGQVIMVRDSNRNAIRVVVT